MVINELVTYMAEHGYTCPEINKTDDFIRFASPNSKDPNNKNAWLIVNGSYKAATFGDWSADTKHTWFAKDFKGDIEQFKIKVKKNSMKLIKKRLSKWKMSSRT